MQLFIGGSPRERLELAPDCGHDEIVAAVRTRLLGADEATDLAQLFKLLADPNRARLLHALRLAGELCVGDLADLAGMAESTVSHALRLLRTAGVVRRRRDGRLVYYALDDEHVTEVLDLALAHLSHLGDPPSLAGEAAP